MLQRFFVSELEFFCTSVFLITIMKPNHLNNICKLSKLALVISIWTPWHALTIHVGLIYEWQEICCYSLVNLFQCIGLCLMNISSKFSIKSYNNLIVSEKHFISISVYLIPIMKASHLKTMNAYLWILALVCMLELQEISQYPKRVESRIMALFKLLYIMIND